jgi:hypothetical protein
MQDGFSIVVKGSEIQAHVRGMVQTFERAAQQCEEEIEKAKAEAHEEVDRQYAAVERRRGGGPSQVCAPVAEIVTRRKMLLDAARRHVLLADRIEPDETFRLKREDILFLRLLDDGMDNVRGYPMVGVV